MSSVVSGAVSDSSAHLAARPKPKSKTRGSVTEIVGQRMNRIAGDVTPEARATAFRVALARRHRTRYATAARQPGRAPRRLPPQAVHRRHLRRRLP